MAACLAFPAGAQSPRPDQAQFRDIYKELVETNTTLSSGSCTLAAERMAARLKAAGFADSDLHLIVTPANPKEGALVAVLPGRNPHAKAILLLGHLDVNNKIICTHALNRGLHGIASPANSLQHSEHHDGRIRLKF
jgi:hypothetical protein